jgi:phosphoglycerate dehydrogenase-like enzyme
VDILLLEPLIPEAMSWLKSRHQIEYRPDLAHDARALRQHTYNTRSVVLPRKVMLTREFLDFAPKLQAVARLHSGTDNTDLETCAERGVRVIQSSNANVRANAEYLLGALLLLNRPGVLSAMLGRPPSEAQMGRELNGSTIGLLGLAPTAHTLAGLLSAAGARLVGYDPAVHYSSPIWRQLRVQPVSLTELMSTSDSITVQMLYASRFKHFINDNMLSACKRGQVWTGSTRSALFDPAALGAALKDGRIDTCILDGADADFAGPLSPLHKLPNLFLTPRLGSKTHEAHVRVSWYVAHRLHTTLTQNRDPDEPLSTRPMEWEPQDAGSYVNSDASVSGYDSLSRSG